MDPARITEEQNTQRRAAVLGFTYVDTTKLQKQLFKDILSVQELYSLRVIPLTADAHNVLFGITNTTSQQTLNNLRQRFTDQRIAFSLISDTGYQEFMKLYDPPKKVEYQDISIASNEGDTRQIIDTVSATLSQVRPDDMLAYLVQQAYQLKASDIHLECQKENTRVRFRIDGVLHPVAYIENDKYRHLTSALASAANISVAEKSSQTGHISRSYKMATGEEVTINLRVETVPSVYGMDAVMRLFNLKTEDFQLDKLGLSTAEQSVVDDIIKRPTGLVLIVGPTGSGKTTTLYSLINTLNTDERKIITLEDPVEYNIAGITQIPVEGSLGSQSFAEKLRAVLRLDPDIVMVGEIRDQDTAKTALQAALTGHLVLSTFHASSASAALSRLMDMVGPNPLLTSAIRLIMAQRLVRKLDDQTKQPYKPDPALLDRITEIVSGLPPTFVKPNLTDLTLYKAGNSQDNPFGYAGQLAVREQLVMTPGLQQLLTASKGGVTTEQLEEQAVKEGLVTIHQDAILKAIAGMTTVEEVYRVFGE